MHAACDLARAISVGLTAGSQAALDRDDIAVCGLDQGGVIYLARYPATHRRTADSHCCSLAPF
jgi:hypothetical protein